jgi:hypothetical protein
MVTKTELDGLLRTLQAKYDKTIQEIGERLSSVEKENVNLMKQV